MKARNNFSFLKDNHVISNLDEFLKTLPADIKCVILQPIPKTQKQYGGTCGYSALSISTYYWHFFDENYPAYDARKKNKVTPSLAEDPSLRFLGKEFNEHVNGIFDMEIFKKIADKIGYNVNIYTFNSTNAFSNIVKKNLDQHRPIILPVDCASTPYAVHEAGGENSHHVVLIGYIECDSQLYCILTSHNEYFLVSAKKLFSSCNNLKCQSYASLDKTSLDIKVTKVDLNHLKNHLATIEPKKLHLAKTVSNENLNKKREQNNKKTVIMEKTTQPPTKKFKSSFTFWKNKDSKLDEKIATSSEVPLKEYTSFSKARSYWRN